MKMQIIAWLLPLCLAMSALSPVFGGSAELALQMGSLLILAIAGLVLAGPRFIESALYGQSLFSAVLLLLFAISAIISSVLAEEQGTSLVLITGILLCFAVSGGVWNADADEVKSGLARYCVFTTGIIAVYWLLNHGSGQRFGGVLHPNYWGLLCFGCFCLAGLVRTPFLATAIRFVSLLVILDAQARGALLSTAVAAAVLIVFRLRSSRIGADMKAAIVMGSAVVLVFSSFAFREQLYALVSQAFLLNDPSRGATSGFSGRSEIWRTAIQVFSAHPWFGVGPGMQKYYFTSFVGLEHAHSGYLNTLDQFGVIGTSLFLALAGISIARLARMGTIPVPGSNAGIAFVIGYAVEAIFEPKLINIGNPVSIVFLMFLLQPLPVRLTVSVPVFAPRPTRRPVLKTRAQAA